VNKTEEQYAWMLEVEKREGLILSYGFEAITIRLTEPHPGVTRVSYTPDFFIVLQDGTVRIDEVKGPFIREDSDLKFKMAAERFPYFQWRMIQRTKREGFKVIRHIERIKP